MKKLLTRGWNAAFHPINRLDPDFPLTGKKLGKAYGIGLLWLIGGSFLPLVLLLAYIVVAVVVNISGHPQFADAMVKLLEIDAGHDTNPAVLTGLVVSSFVLGFGLQLRYISRVMRRTGHRLLDSVGFGLGAMRKSTWLSTTWAISWRVLLALAITQGGEYVISCLATSSEQPTITFAKSLSGGNFLAFFVMAVVLAPLLEETVFRGLLFQALRGTFHQWRQAAAGLSQAPRTMIGRLTTSLGATVFATETRVDVAAVCLSAALFSVEHMQFDPITMLVLFGAGVVLAETFRRTGTLWASILLHALSNAIATVLLVYQP